MIDVNRIEEDLLGFLKSRAPGSHDLSVKTDLVRAGLMEPLLNRELAEFVESAYGVTLDPDELSPQHLRTVRCVVRLVVARRAGETHYPSPLCRELDALSVLCLPDELRPA